MDRRARGESAEAKQEKKSSSRLGIIAVLVLVLGGAGLWVFVIQPKLDAHRLTHQHGRANGSIIGNDFVTVIDHVSITRTEEDPATQHEQQYEIARTRMTSIDRTTGKQLAQKVLEGQGTCVRATPELLWCDHTGLELYDARTLKLVANVEKEILGAKLGKVLSTKVAGNSGQVGIVEGARATLLLDDGRAAIYDAAARKLSRADPVPDALASNHRPAIGFTVLPSCSESTSGVRAKVGNSAETYLSPKAIGLDPPVFFHHTSLKDLDDKLQLSRLTKAGGLAWTVELGYARCEQLSIDDKHVVLATTNALHRALVIDVESGKILWNAKF